MSKKLYLVVGKSGSGKDYIIDKICDKYNANRVISRTTRESRGKDDLHIFVTKEQADSEFDESIARTIFNRNRYYVLTKDIENKDFYIIDPKGVESIYAEKYLYKNKELKDIDIATLFIKSNWFIRFIHMVKRGDKFIDIIKRLKHDRKAFKDFKGDVEFKSSNELYNYLSDKIGLRGDN